MGSPEFAVPILEALDRCREINVVCVVTQPDRARGRGRQVLPTPVRAAANRLGFPSLVMTKENYRDVVKEIAAFLPDVIVVAAFGVILKDDLLELPRLGCVNLHASLLPKYRGVSPIQAAILAGDETTGCTTILMDRGIDTGDILLSASEKIFTDDTLKSLGIRLSELGSDLVIRTLMGLREGSITPRKQDLEAGSYTKKIRKEHGQVDWTQPADRIWRHVRAMYPWPAAYTFCAGKRLILIDVAADLEDDHEKTPGTVLSLKPFRVACGGGALEIKMLKPEGKFVLEANAFAAGTSIRPGDILG